MYKYLLQSVNGVEWFGITTFTIFFLTFCFAAVRALLAGKSDLKSMSELPLQD